MPAKQQLLQTIRDEFDRWEELLAGLSEEQLAAPVLNTDLSIKDTLAHLMAWQQRTLVRLEAGRLGREPQLPVWPAEDDESSDELTDEVNAWIYQTYRDQPWSAVYAGWRAGYQRFMELAAAIPEKDLLETGKYPWLKGYSLADIVQSSYEHHHIDHLEPLLAWLGKQGKE